MKYKTALDFKEFTIENNIITKLDIDIIAHFGNTVSLVMDCRYCRPLPLYNSTANIGYVIRRLVEFLDIEREDGITLSQIKNIPIRIVYDGNKTIAFGHFMDDKFITIEDLMEGNKDA